MAQPSRLSRSAAPQPWETTPPAPSPGTRPRLWEGQDVLARWTDGLLYLGTIKKVDSAREVCLVQFEDDSQFLVLWKDISPAALPGEELLCCVCRSESVVPGNRLVSCEKCRHAYHQDCHIPRAPAPGEGDGPSPWVCRQCVFAIATKRGGALKKGPYARAMLGMKLSLPYGLKGLDWDAGHLSNRQQSYCYCGGPGEWNLKMLQCRSCLQWFHEACTQCLSKPLLYGDRFYEFECCVCRGGPESVKRLQLRWVDVAHLVLYHLSVCCKKKYFDFDREILPFTSENWDSLLLGELSDTPKGERSSQLLSALNSHKDRFISGKEIKKRKCLFGLHARAPPPVESPTGDGAHTRLQCLHLLPALTRATRAAVATISGPQMPAACPGHPWTFKLLVFLQIPQGVFPTQHHLRPQTPPLFPPEDQFPRVLPLYVVAYLLELVWVLG
uniref:PHD finger protein 1 n=1 Tax=Sarcophilus harrisii TaxID=9305 RepID=G3VG97_SARHA